MKYPQTFCWEMRSKFTPARLETIYNYGCCAFVLLWCLGIDADDYHAIELVSDMIDAGVIEKDCTVHWVEACRFLTGPERRTPVRVEGYDRSCFPCYRDRVYRRAAAWFVCQRESPKMENPAGTQ